MRDHIIHWIAFCFFSLLSLTAFLAEAKEEHEGLKYGLHIIAWAACAIAGLMLHAILWHHGLELTTSLLLLFGACVALAFGLTVWGFHTLRK